MEGQNQSNENCVKFSICDVISRAASRAGSVGKMLRTAAGL